MELAGRLRIGQESSCSEIAYSGLCVTGASVQIWATMNNCAGVSRDVMLSQDALEAIVHKTLEQLRNPGLQCLAMVTQELLRISDECTPSEIHRCALLPPSCRPPHHFTHLPGRPGPPRQEEVMRDSQRGRHSPHPPLR